jgi:thiamine-monophosphate kinase
MSHSAKDPSPVPGSREDQIIRRLARPTSSVLIGVGDDCAQLPDGHLVCTDTLVEHVHFDLAYCSAADVAWKSVAVNMSDIAAMGGRPLYALLNLSLPRIRADRWVDEFSESFLEALTSYGAGLIGGDTTASPDRIVISVTVIGCSAPANTKRRSTARFEDEIFVTGWLGNSRAGLHLLSQSPIIASDFPVLVHAHRRPTARIEEGSFLANASGVRAMMDLSDGLAIDLARLTTASGCSAEIDLATLPIHEEFSAWASRFERDRAVEAALGGEDFELLVSIQPDFSATVRAEFEKRFAVRLTKIGTMTPSGRNVFVDHGAERLLKLEDSFAHF